MFTPESIIYHLFTSIIINYRFADIGQIILNIYGTAIIAYFILKLIGEFYNRNKFLFDIHLQVNNKDERIGFFSFFRYDVIMDNFGKKCNKRVLQSLDIK